MQFVVISASIVPMGFRFRDPKSRLHEDDADPEKSKIIEVAFEKMRCKRSAGGFRNSILCDGVWRSETGLRINNARKNMIS